MMTNSNMYKCIYTYIYMCIRTFTNIGYFGDDKQYEKPFEEQKNQVFIFKDMFIYVPMYIYIYIYIYIHIYIYIYIYI
jgi:hypothetical protein